MGKYFPLAASEQILSRDNMASYLGKYEEMGLIKPGWSIESFRQFVFGEDYFTDEYKGLYEKLNNVIMHNREVNKRYIPFLKMSDIDTRRTEWRDYLGVSPVILGWQKFKIVYKIDNDFFHEIKNTQDLVFQETTLKSLPYPTMYIDLSDVEGIDPFVGAFVHTEVGILHQTLAIYMVANDITTFSFYGDLDFSSEEDIEFNIKVQQDNFIRRAYNNEICADELVDVDYDDHRQEIINAIFQLIMFLNVNADDIMESPVTKYTYKPSQTIKNKFSEVKMMDVGVRYGAAIRIAKQQALKEINKENDTTKSSGKPRKPVRPHVRCAHWQRFHVGKGRKEIRINWIPPVFVCGGKEIPVTIREVKK